MPPRPFVNDALWRCLCPGFLPKVQPLPAILAQVGSAQWKVMSRDSTPPCRSRQLRVYNSSTVPLPSLQNNVAPSFQSLNTLSSSQNLRDKPPLAQLSTPLLYEHLRTEGARGNFDAVMNICRVLVKDRNERLNKEMYTAVLHSFVSETNGTGGKVRKVLEEMGFWNESGTLGSGQPKIELDARGCECVLEVLAVHPDYLLRSDILDYMKSRWFTVSDRGRCFIIAGMLRERHFEQALETMDDMVNKKARIEGWVFDKAMWMLLEFGEVEEAFYVLSLKGRALGKGGASTVKLSDALWASLLDAASQKQLVSLTILSINECVGMKD